MKTLTMHAAIKFMEDNKPSLTYGGKWVRNPELGPMGATSVEYWTHADGRRFRFEGSNGGCALYDETPQKLYAWQPNGHGELSYFVCAANQNEALAAVEAEQQRLLAMDEPGMITQWERDRWGTDYYTLTEVEPGVVVTNCND